MILEGGISYNQNWDKNGNIYYTDENGQDHKLKCLTEALLLLEVCHLMTV